MDCTVVVPVGPNHEEIHQQAIESIRVASLTKGPFSKILINVVDDTKGELGRSKARNLAVESCSSEWIFFLDADDRMHPDAFKFMGDYMDYDAVWGNIWEFSDGVCVWRFQVPAINTYDELLAFDPYLTLQMGHFVKRESFIPFNEEMDCGEDWDYYLKMWQSKKCIKIRAPFFVNQRGFHSTGPRSATGREWSNIVGKLVEEARNK